MKSKIDLMLYLHRYRQVKIDLSLKYNQITLLSIIQLMYIQLVLYTECFIQLFVLQSIEPFFVWQSKAFTLGELVSVSGLKLLS